MQCRSLLEQSVMHTETWWVASRRQLQFGQMNCSRHWLREQSGYGNYSFSTHTHLDTVSEQSVHTLFPAKWPVSHVRKKCSLVVDSIEDRTIRIWSFSHKLTLNLLLINSRTVNTASKGASEQGARKGMLKIHTDTHEAHRWGDSKGVRSNFGLTNFFSATYFYCAKTATI